MAVPRHPQEDARLLALRSCGLLDTPREHRFDRLVFIAAQILKVPMSTISFVDAERQWFKAWVGPTDRETSRDVSFCAHTILQSEPLVVEDARDDPRFAQNPFVAGAPFVRFYVGVPLRSEEGLPIGSLCVVDWQPRRVTPEQMRSLVTLAREVEELIHPREASMRAAD